MREQLRAALILGASSGVVEVAVRAAPRLGLTFFEMLSWVTMGAVAGLAVAVPALAFALSLRRIPGVRGSRLDRPQGWVLAALIALHAGLAWRFEVVLNLPVADPRVYGGLGLIALSSASLGLGMGRLVLRKVHYVGLIGFVAFWGAMLRGVPPQQAEVAPGPNVLLISWDTARPDRLATYGGPAATPALDRLAAEGAVFEQAISVAPLTEPAHLSMLTGLPTTETGVVVNGTELGDRPALVQRAFQAAGVSTGAAVSGFPLHGKYGWTQGFDVYDDDFGPLPGLSRLSLYKALEQLVFRNVARERKGDRTVARALKFLKRNEAGRWFLFVHFYDPHGPYEAAPVDDAPRDGEPLALPPYWPPAHKRITSTDYLIAAYDKELTYTDSLTGELLDFLDGAGLTENTLVVVTADHGESLTEHSELFDHGGTLFDPSLRIPLVMRLPGGQGAGTQVGCQVSLVDVTPTLADAAGLPKPAGPGRSLLPAASGAACESRPVVASAPGERSPNPPIDYAVRQPSLKYIRYAPREGGVGHEALYSLGPDPEELKPRSSGSSLPELSALLDAALKQGAAPISSELDAETMEALRALGYVEGPL